jgi:hypothetical protein
MNDVAETGTLAGTTEDVLLALGVEALEPVTYAAVFFYASQRDPIGMLGFLDQDPIGDGVDGAWDP